MEGESKADQPVKKTSPIIWLVFVVLMLLLLFSGYVVMTSPHMDPNNALRTQSLFNCRQWMIGVSNYTSSNSDKLPPNELGLRVLIPFALEPVGAAQAEQMFNEMASSPLDRKELFEVDYVLHSPAEHASEIEYPSKTVMLYDKAALHHDNRLLIAGMADGTARMFYLPRELDELLQFEQNAWLIPELHAAGVEIE